jgi:hypothetical protein
MVALGRVVALALVFACGAPAPEAKNVAPLAYDANSRWICVPGAAFDACNAELTATAIAPDGTRTVVENRPLKDAKVDCFYVYPTVDLDLVPGNHMDFSDTRKEKMTTLAQVGLFIQTCAVWAPLYRQVTIGTYFRSKERREKGLAIAFGDVEAAFREFLSRTAPDRKMVLVGHSQGAGMIMRLLAKFFEGDPAMRSRLLLAMPIGADVEADAFTNVPICKKANETGCIVTYRSYADGENVDPEALWMPAPGHETACVNPATLDGGTGRLSRAFFPAMGELRRSMRGLEGIETPYVELRDHYSARCVTQPSGFSYLAIGEVSRGPVDLHKHVLKMGLHVLDMQLAQGDLVDMIARRVALLR